MPENTEKQQFTFHVQAPRFAGLVDCRLHTPVLFRIGNGTAEDARLRLVLGSAEGLVRPFEQEVFVRGGEETRLSVPDLFSPACLAGGGVRRASFTARLLCGERELGRAEASVCVLPYGFWEGTQGDAARLAAFADPSAEACRRALAIAQEIAKRRNGVRFCGYGADRAAAETALSAVFSAVKAFRPVRAVADFRAPVSVLFGGAAEGGTANALALGLLACSCLEAAGFNPVLAVGDARVGVGVWLYDSAFLSDCTADLDSVCAYLKNGAENLAFFDADDLFADRKISCAQSGRRFARGLAEGAFRVFADLRRCRGAMPQESAPVRESAVCGAGGEGAAWERQLVDRSARNPLLHFTGKHALRVACGDADALIGSLGAAEGLRLVAVGALAEGARRELDALERAGGELCVYAEREELRTAAARMMRAEREAEEESGAGVLYLSFGLFRLPRGGKEAGRAPVALLPVSLSRGVGGAFFLRAREGGFFPNPALAEFFAQKFGEGPACFAGTLAELFAVLRAAFPAEEGGELSGEVYLSAFAFHGDAIWNDLKRNLPEFRKNALVRALLSGRAEEGCFSGSGAPPADPPKLLLPTDASQDEAVALSDAGGSFVLHGPPGTGKSQTIVNIIANALFRGKRVLFVAEKQAALGVVRRRLESVGLGDFCLELPADRAAVAEIARKLERTLSLAEEQMPDVAAAEAEFASLERALGEPVQALHAEGRLGTPYRAILRALSLRDAPPLQGATPAFYNSLTEEDVARCRHALTAAASAAKACGKLRGAPFSGVEPPAYSEGVRDGVLCACEALLAACSHAERMLALFLAFYRQRVPLRTDARLHALAQLAARLERNEDAACFSRATAEELRDFCAANEALTAHLDFYLRRFRALAEVEDAAALSRYAREGGDWRLYSGLRAVVRRLSRLALSPLDEADIPKYLKTLSEIYAAAERVRTAGAFSAFVCDREGRLRPKKREEFMARLSSLHALCREAFAEFDGEAFHVACIRASGGCAAPLLRGLRAALGEFFSARQAFLHATGSDPGGADGEDALKAGAEKAAALIENIDLLRGWCRCRETLRKMERAGAGSLSEALGRGGEKQTLAAFEGEVFRRYAEESILARPALTRFTAGSLGACAERYRAAGEELRKVRAKQVRASLISRLPKGAEYAAERSALSHAALGRGGSVRGLLAAAPRLAAAACPCFIMSPASVAQYLKAEAGMFDLVVFDEASQMTAAEAAGSVARAKSAVVVGDPRQLPPTRFFRAGGEEGDGESVLDEFLALGMPERKLRWHYRSRHESLIAFSNAAYYDGALYTVPSPAAGESRVKFIRTDGVYERGGSKRNRVEAEALAAEVVRRLSDPVSAKQSMGVVTFSVAQQEEVGRALARALAAHGLTEAAYGREEPLFVKNLENVQGDERDVVLFSVGYGPDASGKFTNNFGPLNREGGWRRLNVAVSRAREEMLVFASFSPSELSAERPLSRGAAEFKAFLEFAENGKTPCVPEERPAEDVGAYLARELARCGYACRQNVGASAFRADVAVLDPRGGTKYLLAVLTDGEPLAAKERYEVREAALARAGWNIARVESVAFYANPKREIGRLKAVLDGLCGRKQNVRLSRYERRYRYAPPAERRAGARDGEEKSDEAIRARLREIVSREQPISRAFLKKRLTGGASGGRRASERLDRLIDGCGFLRDFAAGTEYFYLDRRALSLERYRTEGKRALRKTAEDYTVYEVVSMIRGALEDRVALYPDDLGELFATAFRTARAEGELAAFLMKCVRYGEERGVFSSSPSERITLR